MPRLVVQLSACDCNDDDDGNDNNSNDNTNYYYYHHYNVFVLHHIIIIIDSNFFLHRYLRFKLSGSLLILQYSGTLFVARNILIVSTGMCNKTYIR